MSENLDSSTRAVVDQCEARISHLLEHFVDDEDATWDEYDPSVALLETLKMDLTMLASVIESRIQEVGQTDQDFGT